jgi:hypothetical protein
MDGRTQQDAVGAEGRPHAASGARPWPISPATLAALVYAVNLAAIVAGVASGHRRGDLALRFEEKQSITFLSSNQLALTALLGWVVYLLRRRALAPQPGSVGFWLLSAAGFFYLMLDESFQFHEGMDSRVLELVDPDAKNPRLDGLSTAVYGLGALVVCWLFRAEITRFPAAFVFFCVGGAFLLATSALNFGDAAAWRVVLEESSKLLGVASFLLAHIVAFLGSLAEVEQRTPRGRDVSADQARRYGSSARQRYQLATER